MKIILGTANFNAKYGLKKKKFDHYKSKNLSNLLKNSKINIFDTALDYKLNYEFLKNLKKPVKIISKIKLPKGNIKKSLFYLENQILN